jgi:hypothetical protein
MAATTGWPCGGLGVIDGPLTLKNRPVAAHSQTPDSPAARLPAPKFPVSKIY